MAMDKLEELQGCEMHLTHIPPPGDEAGLKRLGVNLTSDPNFPAKCLFFQRLNIRLRLVPVSSCS